MIFDYFWLQSFFKKKLPEPEELARLITEHSFEAVARGTSLDVSVPPARAGDCLSHQGLAREIGAILGYRVHHPETVARLPRSSRKVSVKVDDPADCPRYTLSFWSDISLADSTEEMKRRLRAAGSRPINGIVDMVNYLMLEMGQPVHVFDADKIAGEITVRRARKGEEFISLEGKKYLLAKDILVIADRKGPLALAGLKGGQRAEVTDQTKNILVESANFNSRTVRRASRLLDLRTEASWRFENGLDPNLSELAQRRLRKLAERSLKPRKVSMAADVSAGRVKDRLISLDLTWVRQILGSSIPTGTIGSILRRLDFKVDPVSNRKIKVRVPSWRLDVRGPEDLVEEIGRINGYHRIEAVPPRALLIPPTPNRERTWQRHIKNFLTQFGLNESYHYSLLGEKDIDRFDYPMQKAVKLENPVSAHYQYLRFSLLPCLLAAVRENQKHFPDVALFEVGRVFEKPVKERSVLAAVFCERAAGSDKFYEAKGVVESLLASLGITDFWFDDYQAEDYFGGSRTWHPKNRAEIKIGDTVIGFLGEILPRLADEYGLPDQVFAFEMDLDQLIEHASEQQEYQPISPYAAIIRDVSLVVPAETPIERIIRTASLKGEALVRDVDLVDVYHDDAFPEEKSVTLRIVYQSPEKNISSTEVNQAEKNIIREFEKLNWQLRRKQNDS